MESYKPQKLRAGKTLPGDTVQLPQVQTERSKAPESPRLAQTHAAENS